MTLDLILRRASNPLNVLGFLIVASILLNGYFSLRVGCLPMGTTSEDIVAALGPPSNACPFEGKRWEYIYFTYPPVSWVPINIVWSIKLKNGRLVSKELTVAP